MRRGLLALAAIPLGLAAPIFVLRAQSPTATPHGDLKRDCADCHTAERWTPVVNPPGFRHDEGGFRLEAAHARLSCRSCHRSLLFAQVGTACADCHKDPHRGELGFRCDACHTPRSWSNQREMAAAHSRTRFPLVAAHAVVDCQACHREQRPNEYANTPTDCAACHARDYEQAKNPDHVRGGFPRRCQECHATAAFSWRGARFTQHDRTRFPLSGAHQRVECARCHVGGRYAGTPTACAACHDAAYRATTNPNHAAGGYPTTCESCHTTAAWRPATLDHSRTRFPLSGAHQRVECARCHVGGRYSGTPTACVSCHEASYRATTNPNHVASGFPTTCDSCHSTTAWRPATLDHDRTRFPLTGAHRGVDCGRCHQGGRYAGTPTDCYACHEPSYRATSNPNHAAANFPTSCQNCHVTSAWRPATFNHDGQYFPIYSGNHRGRWSSCSECHVNPGNYRQFECILCHEHSNRSEVDKDHRGVSGYRYASADCYRCHPRGSEK